MLEIQNLGVHTLNVTCRNFSVPNVTHSKQNFSNRSSKSRDAITDLDPVAERASESLQAYSSKD